MSSTVHDVMPFEGRFPSWEAFDVARKTHCEKTYTMYVCRNTVKVAVANKRRKLQVPDSWVYDRKIYVCTHGYKRVSRSSGSRPRQNVRYTNCKARFTACVLSEMSEDGREVLFIKVTGQHLVHSDHLVTLEQWRMYSQNRAAVIEHPYLTHEAELMRRIGSNKRAAREHIETLTGKVCTMKDMHNLYARLKKREKIVHTADSTRSQQVQAATGISLELGASQNAAPLLNRSASNARVEPVLQQFVDADVENHVSIMSGDDGSDEAVCLTSRAMKEHLQVFPELIILDVSVTTLINAQGDQQLHGFLSMDALGNAKPVFLVRSTPMSPSLMRRVCQDFKRTHPTWRQTKVLIMNKLLPDTVQELSREFPEARILLCQLHVLQLLNELVTHPQQAVRIQATGSHSGITGYKALDHGKIAESLQHLVFAHSESRYNEAKNLLARQLTAGDRKDLLATFDRDWEPYRALWASYARAEQFDFSSFFTKAMNSFWEPMKKAFKRTSDSTFTASGASKASHPLGATKTVASCMPFSKALNWPVADAGDSPTSLMQSNVSSNISLPTALRGADLILGASGNSTSEVLTTMKFVENEWTSKMLILELTKPVIVDRWDPLLHLMVNCLSSFAVDLISSQLTIQSSRACGSVTVTKTRAPRLHQSSNSRSDTSDASMSSGAPVLDATMRWLNKVTREMHILQRDGSACDCEFFALYQLPCRHLIWYEDVALQYKQLSLVAVGPRWLLRSFQVPKMNSQRESNEIEYHLL